MDDPVNAGRAAELIDGVGVAHVGRNARKGRVAGRDDVETDDAFARVG